VPGSWWPLALMMTIFFTRYATAVALTMRPAVGEQAAVAVSAAWLCGLASGFFVARAARIWRVRGRSATTDACPLASA
jgi:hypothetical protein